MTDSRLNIAGRLADIFVTSRLTILLILACGLFGIFTVLMMPREENPQINMPAATVQVMLPGASPEEVEEHVIRPLESIVKQIPGVDHTFATAVNSAGTLMVQFKVGQNKEKSMVDLYDRVIGERDLLPAEAGAPIIRSMDVDDVPIITVTLASEKYDDYALKRLADRLIEGLRSLKEVSTTYVKGGRDREIRIEIDPVRMQAFGVTLVQVRSLIDAANVFFPIDTIVQQGQNQQIALDGHLVSDEDLKRLIVGKHAGRPIYLSDIADIVDGPPEEIGPQTRIGFGPADHRFDKYPLPEIPAVTLAVAKKKGSNSVFVANDVLERIERMRKQFVPSDVEVIITRNDGQKADDTVNHLMIHLGVSVFAVFIVIAVFLGLKEALIIVVTVPLILSLTLGTDYVFGLTINRVTLFALIISLGLLVDAAIVVIENIQRNYTSLGNSDKRQATVYACNEIGNPTNLATLAIMLVLGSIHVMTGMPGQYLYPVAFTVPVAMAASLVVAYSIVPWAAVNWLVPGKAHGSEDQHSGDRLYCFYHKIMTPLIDRPKLRRCFYILVGVAMALAAMQPLWQFIRPVNGRNGPQSWFGIEVTFLPKDNKNTVNITIDMPETTPVEVTDQIAREIGVMLRGIPEVCDYQTWLGEAGVMDLNALLRGSGNKKGPYVAEIRVNFTDKTQRSKTSIDIAKELRPRVTGIAARYPGSTVQVVEDPPGPPLRATVLAEIYGKDPHQLRTLSGQVKQQYHKTYDMAEVNDSEMEDVYEHRLVVDREKAALSGITSAEVAAELRRLLHGEILGVAHILGEKNPVPIRLKTPRRHQINPALLSCVTITNQQGQRVPFSELVTVQPAMTDRPILHKDGERVTFVGGELGSTAPVYAVIDLDRRLNGMKLSDGSRLSTGNIGFNAKEPDIINGYRLLWDGEQRMMMDAYGDMMVALALALILVFLILVAYYQSFALPLVAMSAIPLAMIGIFPGHWIMDTKFSVTSMVGVIALAGIVVRNSLLIIDFVLEYESQGMGLRQAVLEAGAIRLRPILLTALAIVFGSLVILRDPMFGGLAVSLIFGTIASTILTMIIVPLFLYMFLKRNQRMQTQTEIAAEEVKPCEETIV